MTNRSRFSYPLSHPQKRIWYIEQMYQGTSAHNIGGLVQISGHMGRERLEEAIHLFIEKNEGLRLQLTEEHGEARQYVQPYVRDKLRFLDFSHGEHPAEEMQRYAQAEFRKPFVLLDAPLFEFAILKVSETESAYYVKFHHLVSDGWTIYVMTHQIRDFYTALTMGEEVHANVEYSYLDYLTKEQEYLKSERFQKARAFWMGKYSEVPDVFLQKSADDLSGHRKRFFLAEEQSRKVHEFLNRHRISLNVLFVALMLMDLSHRTQQTDLIVGTPVLNRSGAKEKSVVGMFTSTLPFRMKVPSDGSVLEWISQVGRELKQCYFHQKYPYDLLVQDIELNKKGYDNLFQVCVNTYNTHLDTEMGGAVLENVEFYSGEQLYSLQLVLKDWTSTGQLEMQYDYKAHDYTESQVEELHGRLTSLLEQVLERPEQLMTEIDLLTPEERENWVYRFNATANEWPEGRVLHDLITEQAERTPEAIALEFGAVTLTYRDVEERSNQLAHRLRQKGIGRETLVGLLLQHSPEMVIAALAVLKAGGAYVPIDPEAPHDRMEYVLQESNVRLLLTNFEVADRLSCSYDLLRVDEESSYADDKGPLEPINEPSDLAYVIYTSGSTGLPKGTLIEHRGLVNYAWWASRTYLPDADDVFALYSSFAFDLTVTSIFAPLLQGNKVVIYARDEDEFLLHRILRENRATVLKLTPAHLSLLKGLDLRSSTVRRFIVGGEDLKVALAAEVVTAFGGKVEIYNEYGPTETVVGCMIHRYDDETDARLSVPIGRPIANMQIYLLNPQLQPVPTGVIGELYISGCAVARGYLNRPELTEEKFLDNPFVPGLKMYKTGDLAVRLESGLIEYMGRSDHQVKIRGYRVELGEVEGQLLEHPSVADAVVIDREAPTTGRELVAYVVLREVMVSFQLRNDLAARLPAYMMPSHLILLDVLPLTSSGKVDRNALPAPETVRPSSFDEVPIGEAVGPLLSIVQDVLQLEHVSPQDNFYHLGGESIKAIQVVNKLAEQGMSLKVRDMLAFPVLREMAAMVSRKDITSIAQESVNGALGATPITKWFFAQRFANPNHWNQSVLLKIKQPLTKEELQTLLDILVKHHDALRLQWNQEQNALFYQAQEEANQVAVYDLRGLPVHEQEHWLQVWGEQLKRSMRLEAGRLFKAALFAWSETEQRLLLTAHHLLVDGVSWRILLDDLGVLLQALQEGRLLQLPPKTHTWQRFAEELVAYRESPAIQKEEKYWQTVCEGITEAIPADFDFGEDTVETTAVARGELNAEETSLFLTQAQTAYNTQPNDMLLVALVRAVQAIKDQAFVAIELEGHGREPITDLDLTRTVGWFTTMYPILLPRGDADLSSHIKEVKEQLRQVPGKGIGYGVLKYLSGRIAQAQAPAIRFNYLGETDNGLPAPFELAPEGSGRESCPSNRVTCLIDILVSVSNGRLRIAVTYSQRKFADRTMEGLVETYLLQLRSLLRHCCEKDEVEFTPSDFDTATVTLDELDALFD